MKQTKFQHEFVDSVPEPPEAGVLYISLKYETAIHLCACGCGTKVVTPLSVDEWIVILDGENASLFPSIGNWSFDCRSHYWIRHGNVVWASDWSDSEIWDSRKSNQSGPGVFIDHDSSPPSEPKQPSGLWGYLWRYFSGNRSGKRPPIGTD